MSFDLMKNLIPISICKKCRDNGDFLIIMNTDGDIFYLNDTAKYIYGLFSKKYSIQEILEKLKEKYEAAEKDDEIILKHDIVEIIRDFQWQNIIKLMEV